MQSPIKTEAALGFFSSLISSTTFEGRIVKDHLKVVDMQIDEETQSQSQSPKDASSLASGFNKQPPSSDNPQDDISEAGSNKSKLTFSSTFSASEQELLMEQKKPKIEQVRMI